VQWREKDAVDKIAPNDNNLEVTSDNEIGTIPDVANAEYSVHVDHSFFRTQRRQVCARH